MQKVKKLLSTALAAVMLLSCMSVVNAVDLTDTNQQAVTINRETDVPVKLSTKAMTFSVTVPTALPVYVNNQGKVTTADDAKIVNNSAGAVEVKSVAVDDSNSDWTLVGDFRDLSNEKVGAKKFSLKIQDVVVSEDGSCAAEFDVIPSKKVIDNEVVPGSMGFTYDAHVAPQKDAITKGQIANVVFVVGWYEEKVDIWNTGADISATIQRCIDNASAMDSYPISVPDRPVIIGETITNPQITFTLDGVMRTITLQSRVYDVASFIATFNNELLRYGYLNLKMSNPNYFKTSGSFTISY